MKTSKELNEELRKHFSYNLFLYREWLLEQSKEEILNHAFEFSVMQDVFFGMETLELSADEAKALLDSPSPLKDVCDDFCKLETDRMDVIRSCIRNRAKKNLGKV